ncbi:MAG: hypothetical protein LJF30_16005 [Acidobacteria bacterium]|jgi:hypothetical protein|nr:hypothetical protein [Acidobacteriota bacterium]
MERYAIRGQRPGLPVGRARHRRGPRGALVALCVGAGLSGLPCPSLAQDARRVETGSRVRLTLLSSGKKVVGRFVEANDDTLVLHRKGDDDLDLFRVPRRDVVKVEVSERRSRKGAGAGYGALAGIGAAIVVGLIAGESCSPPPAENSWLTFTESLASSLCFGRTETALLTGVLTVPAGALLGAAVAPGERWRPVDGGAASVSLGPTPGGGVAARLTLRF